MLDANCAAESQGFSPTRLGDERIGLGNCQLTQGLRCVNKICPRTLSHRSRQSCGETLTTPGKGAVQRFQPILGIRLWPAQCGQLWSQRFGQNVRSRGDLSIVPARGQFVSVCRPAVLRAGGHWRFPRGDEGELEGHKRSNCFHTEASAAWTRTRYGSLTAPHRSDYLIAAAFTCA